MSRFLLGRKNLQSGQAMVLIALAFVGLAAFIGLATDTGILFSSVGALRRAVDASALSASNQFRVGQTQSDIEASARQFMMINLPSYDPSLDTPSNPCDPTLTDCVAVRVQSCLNDVTLCPPGTEPKKLVRVEAEMRVNLAFLPIIGYDWTVIRANAISEAGSVDLVLVIDTSESMSYDLCSDEIDNDEDGEIDDCVVFDPPKSAGPDGVPESDVQTCTDAPIRQNQCEPFETVREHAKALVQRMYFPYDRVAIVGFGRTAEVILDLETCEQDDPVAREACITDAIDDPNQLNVELEPTIADCPDWDVDPPAVGDPSGCTPTNTGHGLNLAGNLFGSQGREQAVWVVVLLSDGVANAALRGDGSWVCPPETWDEAPYCQDGDPGPPLQSPRADTDPLFDADDQARRMALFVGCDEDELLDSSGPCEVLGNGAVIFTIGLGDAVVNYDRGGDPEVGGELLQFIAAVGDGDHLGDPCGPVGPDSDCGHYYFVKDVSDLDDVFRKIADRIYTKLNH